MTGIVATHTFINILAGTNIPATGLRAPKNVNIKDLSQYQSGQRDLNPRPIAAAIALREAAVEFIATMPRFVIDFSSDRFGTTTEALGVNQNPRRPVSGCFRFTAIMPSQPVLDMFARPNVPPTCLRTA